MKRALRSAVAYSLTLASHRIVRDRALALTAMVVVALAVLFAQALPRAITDTLDAGARDAVRAAGADADIVLTVDVGPADPERQLVSPAQLLALAADLPERLPSALAGSVASESVTVLGPSVRVGVAEASSGPRISARLGVLPGDAAPTLVSGRLPGTHADSLEVVVSEQAADLARIAVGSVLELPSYSAPGVPQTATVVGVLAADDSDAWRDVPTLFAPTINGDRTLVSLTMLSDVDAVTGALGYFDDNFTGTIRLRLDPAAFTVARERAVAREIVGLQTDPSGLSAGTGANVQLDSRYGAVHAKFAAESRAAVAQLSLLSLGVLGVAAATLLLLARLLADRRASELVLERARGASLVSVLVRGLAESLVVTVLGLALALAAAAALRLPVVPTAFALTVAVVSLVGAPVITAQRIVAGDRRLRSTTNGTQARAEAARRAAARRLVIEFVIVAAAAAAVLAVRARGLSQVGSDEPDLLLSASPLLIGGAVTLVVLRLYAVIVPVVARPLRRSRGALGLLGAMQAERALAPTTLAALTIAIALVTTGGLLVATVASAQEEAASEIVGADARVNGVVSADDVADAQALSGVDAVSSIALDDSGQLSAGAFETLVTVVAVDSRYASAVPGADVLKSLATAVDPAEPLPIVVPHRLASRLTSGAQLSIGPASDQQVFSVTVIDELDAGPSGYADGPFVYVSRDALSARTSAPVEATTLLLFGPGAADAARDVAGPDAQVVTRGAVLAAQRERALVAGVTRLMVVASSAVALLAAVGLVAGVVSGARARSRSLALLRTLGVRRRLGWWLSIAELGPLVLAALVGGSVAGIVTVAVLAPSFGLELLAGGSGARAPSYPPWLFAAVAAGCAVLLGISLIAEMAAQARTRLDQVLRVGGQ